METMDGRELSDRVKFIFYLGDESEQEGPMANALSTLCSTMRERVWKNPEAIEETLAILERFAKENPQRENLYCQACVLLFSEKKRLSVDDLIRMMKFSFQSGLKHISSLRPAERDGGLAFIRRVVDLAVQSTHRGNGEVQALFLAACSQLKGTVFEYGAPASRESLLGSSGGDAAAAVQVQRTAIAPAALQFSAARRNSDPFLTVRESGDHDDLGSQKTRPRSKTI